MFIAISPFSASDENIFVVNEWKEKRKQKNALPIPAAEAYFAEGYFLISPDGLFYYIMC
jgi:hypothetical protein